MPRKRIRQKHYPGVAPTAKPFRRKEKLPDGLKEFAPFSFSIDGVPHTMRQEDFDALGEYLPDVCMVCHAHPRGIVLAYSPLDSQQWGAAPGKDRLIWYTLCIPCYESSDWKTRAEKMLAAWLGLPGYE